MSNPFLPVFERIADALETLAGMAKRSQPSMPAPRGWPQVVLGDQAICSKEETSALSKLADAVVRIADKADPPPADIVGSRHVADGLSCTTVWVAEMARIGQIPKQCVVAGTGHGKPWKFYRQAIDKWLMTR